MPAFSDDLPGWFCVKDEDGRLVCVDEKGISAYCREIKILKGFLKICS